MEELFLYGKSCVYFVLMRKLLQIIYIVNGHTTVTISNYQQYMHIQSPGWTLGSGADPRWLGWTWAKKEEIWSMSGVQTTEQEDCSKFRGIIPHYYKKDPTVVDLLPGTPYNQPSANCCKG
ncbi:hypothetical protein H5410_055157 [Solanum commersonii]|uniref:Uncharacterized protein n=1 Tax=Solanum commersonii TaxID=4109 RepID=A0A9J5WI87_SOLCO|nr:hypothetical protein H5410_055157 [Solanum commersonii]